MEQLGLTHIYTGNGKGKTTAAMGLAVRARGAGCRVLVTQFLKGQETSELEPLRQLGIEVRRTEEIKKFIPYMTEEERENCRRDCRSLFEYVRESVQAQRYDLIILDEVLDAVGSGMISDQDLQALVDGQQHTELVLTGRNPSPALQERADYITVMEPQKHPYERGIQARLAIEH